MDEHDGLQLGALNVTLLGWPEKLKETGVVVPERSVRVAVTDPPLPWVTDALGVTEIEKPNGELLTIVSVLDVDPPYEESPLNCE